MRSTLAVGVAAFAGLSAAGPIMSRQARNDCDILNYALTLEHLEDTFYRNGLTNYTQAAFTGAGFADPFYSNLKTISGDETNHVSFLTTAIQAACPCAVKQANYAFGVTTPKGFVTLSSVLEGVGVSAYLGAAADIASPTYLTVAGSILTVESRHSAYIRAALTESPFPSPEDTPLLFDPVFSLAAQFISSFDPTDSCSAGLPFMASPALAVTPATDFSSVTFPGAAAKYTGTVYAVFWSGLDMMFLPTTVSGNDLVTGAVPAGYTGQVYVALTKSNDATSGASYTNLLSSPAFIEVPLTM